MIWLAHYLGRMVAAYRHGLQQRAFKDFHIWKVQS